MDKFAKYFTRIAPVVLWASVIFMVSSLPDFGGPDSIFRLVLSYVVHFSEFAILSVVIYYALTGRLTSREKSPIDDDRIMIPWILASVYAVTDEIHQAFVPGRHSTVVDFFVDMLGVLFGLIVIPLIIRWGKQLQKNLQKH